MLGEILGGHDRTRLEEYLEAIDLEAIDQKVGNLEAVNLEAVNQEGVNMEAGNVEVLDREACAMEAETLLLGQLVIVGM
jgi:hypothetical protein